ncbi:PBP1A family penicillin-binding protein [Patescibacteria group bacterium]|nr:PBP1A family penicillin-binding protein [Patescibacteria group bacterium]MBU1931541.1 PBP1A family penicillin-binding protein [Patescibacteria group bacterium]
MKLKKLINWLKAGWPPLLIVAAMVLFLFFYVFKDLPSPTRLSQDIYPVSTKIYDRRGELLYEIYTEKNRAPIKLEDLPDYVKQTTIAIEDKNFYQHHGLVLSSIGRAAYRTIFKKQTQGGSTITQQLIKNAVLEDPRRTMQRKIKEALLTAIVELIYRKDQILEMYFNHAPYGGTAYGIEQASLTYFNKSAKDLDLAEAALLAGLPAAPTRYSPFGAHPELAKNRQQMVLKRMIEDNYITEEEAQKATEQTLNYAQQKTNIQAPHFVMYVKDLLVEKYGQRLVEQGGLRVTTSLDLEIQKFAQATVSAEVQKLNQSQVSNGAALITKPKTGEIIAMVGSADYFNQEIDGNVNVSLRPRQPGSSIKPINYAVGLLNGYHPATMFIDAPSCFNVPGQPPYCPRNYDNSFHGPVQMRFALGNSYNIPAVKMLAANGVEAMIATASAMGITTWGDSSNYGLSLTLGGGEVKMTEMATAFGVFANQGLKINLNPILKVEDYKGKVWEEFDWENSLPPGERALPPEVAYLISHILLDNNARSAAFGSSSQLVIPQHAVSVKTGTTNDLRDNWTIGYTPQFLTAVWVGNNDNTPMHPYLVSGITGAAPIWHQIMTHVLKDQPDEWPKKPENIVGLTICSMSGLLPGESGCETRFEYFIKDSAPTKVDNIKQQIWIDKNTNLPSEPGVTDNLELQEHLILSDPVVTDYCLTCPRPVDENGQIQEQPTSISLFPIPEEKIQ